MTPGVELKPAGRTAAAQSTCTVVEVVAIGVHANTHRAAAVRATPTGHVRPLGPWLQYPYRFFESERYCWW
jgi:hypothetical protein